MIKKASIKACGIMTDAVALEKTEKERDDVVFEGF